MITIDVEVRHDQTTANSVITSPKFSTASNGELLLAFIAAGNASDTGTTVNSISGADLAWVPVVRTHTQKGTAEIWRAFSQTPRNNVSVTAALSAAVTSSMTVMSFAGVDPSGVNGSGAIGAIVRGSGSSGAAAAGLLTTRQNSLVVGVGNDPGRAAARTAGLGQTLVHQYLDPSGATYWVQISNGLGPLPSGSSVTINDLSPSNDPYNLSIAEILAAGAPTATSPNQNSHGTPILSDLAGIPVTNACSPGGEVLLTGTGFTGQAPQAATGTPLPTQLAGARVTANGIPMPLLSVADSRVVFECPVLPHGTPLNITVEAANGSTSSPNATVMKDVVPELFTLDNTNQGLILVGTTNQIAMDTNETVPSRPARPGESLAIYATGLGEFDDRVPLGAAARLSMPALSISQIHVVVGGIQIEPVRMEPSPTNAGLTQLFAQLPLNIPGGDAVPIFVRVVFSDGTAVESNEATLAIDRSSAAGDGAQAVAGNSALFVATDAATQGNWKGIYGAKGYNVIDDSVSYPSYVAVTPAGQANHIWAGSTTDVRGLQKGLSATDRIGATWYSSGTFTMDVNVTDGLQHQLTIYCVDWDSGGARSQTVSILDGATNAVLNSQSMSSFQNGKYLVWKLTGHLIIRVTNTSQINGTVSGLFFN